MDWRRPKIQVTDEELERLRSAYRALGPGFPAAALGLFEPEAGAGEGEWCVKMFGRTARCLNAGELASTTFSPCLRPGKSCAPKCEGWLAGAAS